MMELSELRFFQAADHPCPYLKGKQATNVFVDPNQEIDSGVYAFLSNYGFRRSGKQVYKPRCSNCEACLPIRVVINDFTPSKSQKRCLKKNEDLTPYQLSDIRNDECYALYEKYITGRHDDGDMYPPSYKQYTDFLSNSWGATRYLALRDQNKKLVSIAVVDLLHNGLSAMYSFFDPDEMKRSLGVYNILYQILWAQDQDLAFLYLGYLIHDCKKMSYKKAYQPYQVLINNEWRTQD